ncbi:unnamed protein product, partial [Ectocarpus sp. 4 AP-2014]
MYSFLSCNVCCCVRDPRQLSFLQRESQSSQIYLFQKVLSFAPYPHTATTPAALRGFFFHRVLLLSDTSACCICPAHPQAREAPLISRILQQQLISDFVIPPVAVDDCPQKSFRPTAVPLDSLLPAVRSVFCPFAVTHPMIP